jgi:hypothetical protein
MSVNLFHVTCYRKYYRQKKIWWLYFENEIFPSNAGGIYTDSASEVDRYIFEMVLCASEVMLTKTKKKLFPQILAVKV